MNIRCPPPLIFVSSHSCGAHKTRPEFNAVEEGDFTDAPYTKGWVRICFLDGNARERETGAKRGDRHGGEGGT